MISECSKRAVYEIRENEEQDRKGNLELIALVIREGFASEEGNEALSTERNSEFLSER